MSARENKYVHSQRPKTAESVHSWLCVEQLNLFHLCKFYTDLFWPFRVWGQRSRYDQYTYRGLLLSRQSGFQNSEVHEIETKTVYSVQSIINSVKVFELLYFINFFSRQMASGVKQILLSPVSPSLQSANKRMAVFPSPQRLAGGPKSPTCSTPKGLGSVFTATV